MEEGHSLRQAENMHYTNLCTTDRCAPGQGLFFLKRSLETGKSVRRVHGRLFLEVIYVQTKGNIQQEMLMKSIQATKSRWHFSAI